MMLSVICSRHPSLITKMNKYIDRERYLNRCRDIAANRRILNRQRTREERAYRKQRVIFLLCTAVWAVIVIWLLTSLKTEEPAVEVETPPENPVIVQMIPEPVAVIEVEAAPMERDPVREDIPLDAETQLLLWQACEETGIVYELALAVIWQETDFRNITGDDGASAGYMQVQERWHRERMERLGVTDLNDPYGNFLVGCDYLAELAEKDRGIEWMLHAYNGGATYANKMAKAGNVSKYAANVLNYMKILTTEEL